MEEFASRYANHVWYELSEWDMKLIFGQVDQGAGAGGARVVDQHTAITIPWMQAKLMIYFLQINLAIHEGLSGKVGIPKVLFPPEPDPPSGEQDSPQARALYEFIMGMRQRFIDSAVQ
jgi:hypothetical protein